MRILLIRSSLLSLFAFLCFSSANARALSAEAVPGEYLVKLSSEAMRLDSEKMALRFKATIKSQILQDNIVVIKKPTIEPPEAVIEELSKISGVLWVEPNYIYHINRQPNDPGLPLLWGLKNEGQSDGKAPGTAGVDIDAVRAWNLTVGSPNVVVAVIDTGINYTHPDLKENMWVNELEANGQPGVDDDGNGFVDDIYGVNFADPEKPNADPMDDHGHGSHCSGIIGARGNDGKGIVGVNWQVKLMAVKFIDKDGTGTAESAIRAIDYAVKMGAKILNNSWGGEGDSQLLKEAIERAQLAGALFVVAAGNDSMSNTLHPHFPASFDVANILSVAAIDNRGKLAAFSNYGKRSVHIAAPGVNIYSSLLNNEYGSWSGTSMAAPFVSGIAALLLSENPNMNHLEIKERILSTARHSNEIKNFVSSGGIANAYLALTDQTPLADPEDPNNWSSKPLGISTQHPYGKNSSQAFEVEIPEAREIALYFENFLVEKGYDKLELFDRSGEKIGEMSGPMDESYSPVIEGNYVKGIFTSDESVEKYGFDLIKAAYR